MGPEEPGKPGGSGEKKPRTKIHRRREKSRGLGDCCVGTSSLGGRGSEENRESVDSGHRRRQGPACFLSAGHLSVHREGTRLPSGRSEFV